MFLVFCMIALLVTMALLFIVSCGSGTDKPTPVQKLEPIAPVFVSRDYSF